MSKIIEVRDVWYEYPGRITALRGASLSAGRREVVAVIGPNGCGKTTLFFVIAGLLKPLRGRVLLDDKPLLRQLPHARRRIGLVFQDPDDQLFNPTVYDEIAYALRQLDYPDEVMRGKVEEVAEKLGLKEVLSRSPHRLSLGEKKKVAIACVLSYDPDVVLLDEPTANLSGRTIVSLEALIRDLRDEGKTIVIASHNPDFVANVADRVYVMRGGTIIGSGDVRDVMTNESLLSQADMMSPSSIRLYKVLKDVYGEIPPVFRGHLGKLGEAPLPKDEKSG